MDFIALDRALILPAQGVPARGSIGERAGGELQAGSLFVHFQLEIETDAPFMAVSYTHLTLPTKA